MGGTQPWLKIQDEIVGLLARIDVRQFEAVLASFREANRRSFFAGQGRSGLIAQMAAMRFMHAGFPAHVVGEATAPAITQSDRLVLVCGSGKTPVSLGFAQVAKARGAELVLLTHKPESVLAGLADRLLTVPMGSTVQFGGTLFEQVCLILFDALALQLTGSSPDAQARMWMRHTNLQ